MITDSTSAVRRIKGVLAIFKNILGYFAVFNFLVVIVLLLNSISYLEAAHLSRHTELIEELTKEFIEDRNVLNESVYYPTGRLRDLGIIEVRIYTDSILYIYSDSTFGSSNGLLYRPAKLVLNSKRLGSYFDYADVHKINKISSSWYYAVQ